MAVNISNYVTTSQDGPGGDREFVVACKGRPFTILMPTNLPTPPVTFVDHKLVDELKLKMSDLQCSRLNYGSRKLRILGKVSTSVQCISEGKVSGNMHLKALVVENLCENFDVHSIAGIKTIHLLTIQPSLAQDLSSEDDEPTTPKKLKKKKKKHLSTSVSSSRTATLSNTSSQESLSPSPVPAAKESPTSRRSPPGYPKPNFSPSVNISSLNAMGGVTIGQIGHSDYGPVFYPGHGPNLCLPTCRRHDPPINCGFSADWYLPTGFQMCGPHCRGAFCNCLRDYSDYGYYG